MPPIVINRAPWNALVDDSGNNLDGTPWNKAAIKSVLLDPIDVALADADDGTTKDAAQDTILAAHTAQLGLINTAAWTPYTPVWAGADNVQPVLGNGTLAGRSALVGKTCHFVVYLKLGSTSTTGTSSYWTWTLPRPAEAIFGVTACMAVLINTGGGPTAPASVFALNTTTFYLIGAGGGIVNPTSPFTWAPPNCGVYVRGTYESA